MVFVPDTDYVLQSLSLLLWPITAQYNTFMFLHGDFHCILAAIFFPLVFAWIFSRYKVDFFYAFLSGIIGYTCHLICDMIANDSYYYLFWPVRMKVSVWNIIPETGNFYGIGDFKLILVGTSLFLLTLCIRNQVEGSDWLTHYASWLNPVKFWNKLTA